MKGSYPTPVLDPSKAAGALKEGEINRDTVVLFSSRALILFYAKTFADCIESKHK